MSYQVGALCYTTPVDAGAAACSRFTPVSAVTSGGDYVVTTSCESVNQETGALQLQIATTPTNGAASTYRTVEQMPVLSPCEQGESFQAGAEIFFAIVGFVIVPFYIWRRWEGVLKYRGND
ncbi:hypothetical protein D3C72_66570 [compost metagenome]